MNEQMHKEKRVRYDTVTWKALLYHHTNICLKSLIKDPPALNPWNYCRKQARKHLSSQAQLKLEWIIFYHTVADRNASFTAAHFTISRKTLHKWLKRFDENNLTSLENYPPIPKNKRTWMVSREEQERIIQLRKKYMEFGKRKLQVLYASAYGEAISCWKIERVIRRYKLYPVHLRKKSTIEKSKVIAKKTRIHHIKEKLKKPNPFGFLWHIDTIIIWWYGERRYIFTALEESTRIAYARVYTTNSSFSAEDFLKRLIYLVDAKVTIMHSDNGAEFKGAFEHMCKKLNIQQVYSRPYTPKDNSRLEKFNATIQKEWLDFSDIGLNNIYEANCDLIEWLVKYNAVRPHASLNYQTPLEFAQKHYFQVLPRWSATTSS